MILIFIFAVIIALFWAVLLERTLRICPNCGSVLMDKVPNGYHCRYCGKLWHMNIFGKLKER